MPTSLIMEQFTQILNLFSGIGTILMAIFVIAIIADSFTQTKIVLTLVKRYVWQISFVLALGGMTLSLIYSNVIGYPPCNLCWLQRIIIYPQVIIFGIGYMKKDINAFLYSGTLTSIGIIIALYHNWIDLGGNEFITCDKGVSCTARYVAEFGFVTIPLMSLVLLVTLLVMTFIALKHSQN